MARRREGESNEVGEAIASIPPSIRGVRPVPRTDGMWRSI
jgi:hypothetical protein